MNSFYLPATPFRIGCLLFAFLFQRPRHSRKRARHRKRKETYSQLKAFALTGGSVQVKALVIKKDRAQITLDGTVYLSAPVNGKSTGAVFIGDGKFAAETRGRRL
jgi:hypothetical protein